jgi:hypothetical protein
VAWPQRKLHRRSQAKDYGAASIFGGLAGSQHAPRQSWLKLELIPLKTSGASAGPTLKAGRMSVRKHWKSSHALPRGRLSAGQPPMQSQQAWHSLYLARRNVLMPQRTP